MEKLKRIYERAERTVCEVVELDLDKFLISHEESYVDARAILVDWLVRAGFTEKMIERYSGMSQQRINSLKNGFIRRKQKMSVDLYLQEINKKLTTDIQMTNAVLCCAANSGCNSKNSYYGSRSKTSNQGKGVCSRRRT